MSHYRRTQRGPVPASAQHSVSASNAISAPRSAMTVYPDNRAISAPDRAVSASDRIVSASDRTVSASGGAVSASDRTVSALDRTVSALDGAVSPCNQCILCCNSIEWRCLMDCGHVVCHQCGIRLRVLCNKLECPVCRQETTKAVVLACDDSGGDGGGGFNIEGATIAQFRSLFERAIYIDDRHKLAYDDEGCRRACSRLLEHRCPLCGPEAVQEAMAGKGGPGGQREVKFDVFAHLQTHMRRQHDLYCCQLCVDNLAVFSSERRFYTREQLGRHRRKGDPDDLSHKGHPLCQFCDVRYLDKDSLFLHLRRDHFICHICDCGNSNMAFYSDYPQLEDHFRNSHFLCDQAACLEKRFVVFNSKLDLQAHRSSEHSEGKSRASQRQERTVTLELFSNGANIVSSASRSNPGQDRRRQDGSNISSTSRFNPGQDRRRQDGGNMSSASQASAFSSDGRSNQLLEEFNQMSVQEPPQQRLPLPTDFPSLSSVTSSSSTASSASSTSTHPVNSRPPAKATTTAASSGNSSRTSGNTTQSSGNTDTALWFNGRYNRVPDFDSEFPSLSGAVGGATVPLPPPSSRVGRGGVGSTSRPSVVRGQGHSQGASMRNRVMAKPGNRARVIPASASGLDEAFPALSCTPSGSLLRDDPGHARGSNWSLKNNNNTQPAKVTITANPRPERKPATTTKAVKPANFQSTDFPSLSSSSSSSAAASTRSSRGKTTSSTSRSDPPAAPPASGSALSGYRKPARFEDRSSKLVKSVRQIVGENSKFDQFKQCSAEYRRGNISAAAYYDQCLQLLGEDNLGKVFSELLVLLPDINRQTELLDVHQNSSASCGHRTRFMVCPVCSQILVFDDYGQHTFVHYENGEEMSS